MTTNLSLDRREFLKTSGALVVGFSMFGAASAQNAQALRTPKSVAKEAVDSWLTISPDNRVTVYCGKVDLGTGSRTALAQLAAEELDVAFERIEMVMGDTATTPDQWLTAANLTIFQGGSELRRAAASARRALVERAAQRLSVPVDELIVDDGVVRTKSNPAQALRYGELIGDGLKVEVDPKVALRKSSEYRLIGKSIRRVDIPGKVTGEFTYIHDVRVPGMLHARVIRSDLNEAHIDEVDLSEARKVHGYVQTVRKKNFLAVVARSEWAAIKAARAVKVYWRPGTPLPDQGGMFDYWRRLPVAKEEITQTAGDAKAALETSARRVKARYDFAVQTHATIGPSCAVADFKDGKLTVWTSSQATHSMQHELSAITGLPRDAIRLVFVEGAGCYGRNGTEDAAADASLISQTIGKPVRVQWSRADETARSPKSPPRSMDLEAGLDAQGNVVAWNGDFYIALNQIVAFKPLDFPLLAAMESGLPRPGNWVGFLFQNSGQPYPFPNVRVNTKHISETFFRSSHLRSPGRIENSFANESFMDELAAAAKADPAEFRLRYLKDDRAIDVIQAAMKLAGWQARPGPNPNAGSGDVVSGRGISYLRYNNAITYVAAVAEVEVDKRSGAIRVTRVCAGHDCGEMVNPDGVANQVQGGVLQTVSRTLKESVRWTGDRVTSVDWATYPIMTMTEAPKVEVALIDRPGTTAWGAGEPMACAIPAAIGNAVFDATGVRLRSVPFTPEKVKAALTAKT
ncbi:MAG TPA: molybdopterin cofactor-binding domain-containing protein [Burkholderiales bacterium]|jgi:CO/xanthine dehydrogenase Mo-binding subunit|nr:molybdopterin cofactor-binding domain-containing protein [Gemmatimonadales bacterium]HXJ54488.1 molybdopterin cofactor-binding domain-containing protein [Burkholderiales bacterium]